MSSKHPEDLENFTYKSGDGTTITVSRAFRRDCPTCGEEKSIAEFSFRKMKPGELQWRDQPMCGACRQQKRPSKPPQAA